jgi:hypothetical protein
MPTRLTQIARSVCLVVAGTGIALGLIGCEDTKAAPKPVVRAIRTIVVKAANASERRRIAGKIEAVNATSLGPLPLLLLGGEPWYAMSAVLVFGMAVGTIPTLGGVPVLHPMFFRVGRKPTDPAGEPATG